MRKFLIVVPILLIQIQVAFSQEMHLRVVNKPLNTVLNMLGLEISFDDKALSRYKVTVSKSFANPEKALAYLLIGKPFRIEKREQVYIVISQKKYMKTFKTSSGTTLNGKQFLFTGTVTDSQSKERLPYATVCLLESEEKVLATGITDENGVFSISTSRYPQKITISYIGYQTITKDISVPNTRLGAFPMQTKTISLDETIISTDNVRHKLERDNYVVTVKMAEGAASAEELLDKIPGVYFDPFSKQIKVNNSQNILLLVDGVQQPERYIRNLSPERVHSVEIIREPSGRFVSDGYSSIINLKLKENYRGYDMYFSSFSGVSLSEKRTVGEVVFAKPSFGMNYTHQDYSFFANYSRNSEKQNLLLSKELNYNDFVLESENPAKSKPKDSYDADNGAFSFGFNRVLSPDHSIGFQTEILSDNVYSSQMRTLQRTETISKEQRSMKDSVSDKTAAETFVGTIFYQGKWTNRLRMYADFSYNHYSNDISNVYALTDIQPYVSGNDYNEYKNHTLLNVEAQYLLSSKFSLSAGYSNSWRKYASNSSQGVGFLNYREFRNKYFGYLSIYPSPKMQFKIGAAIEGVNSYNRDAKMDYSRILPYSQLNFNFSKAVNLNASYSTSQYYPSLYQLSPMSLVIDNYLSQTGNAELKSAVTHTAAIRLALWDKFSISPVFDYTKDNISESYIENEYKLYRTFSNVNTREFRIQATFEQTIANHFRWSNLVTFYQTEASGTEFKNRPNGWLIDSRISYYNPENAFGFQVEYHHNMRKQVLSQGYRTIDKDNWLIGVTKEFWKKRISLMLNYIPPISLGVQSNQLKVLNTSLYNEKTSLNLKPYNNMLLLKISFRFNHDSSKPAERRSKIMKDEREKQTIEF
ncbi:MAG: hypothetical protein H6Q14_723 [Bacteroidetes bacterium]|nr:hypothetical protein [Bacteroidota bacterium]